VYFILLRVKTFNTSSRGMTSIIRGNNRAIQLVRPISREQFLVPTESLDQLRALGKNARIRVVSIGGVARHGKSTLLELLAGKRGAFRAADGTTPCTQGIHMLITRPDEKKNEYLVRFPSIALCMP
jgi:ribosome biogenesis GTPase A